MIPAMAKQAYILASYLMAHSLPASAINALLISSKRAQKHFYELWLGVTSARCTRYNWIIFMTVFSFVSMLNFSITWRNQRFISDVRNPATHDSHRTEKLRSNIQSDQAAVPLLPHALADSSFTDGERDFWRQPDDLGYKPCLNFSQEYVHASARIRQEKHKYLVVVVSGGLNQQRNQIVDAVVIARILEAVLVIPILHVNMIWADDSEFCDLFDVDHFKRSLKDDLRVVSSLPPTHLTLRPVEARNAPEGVTPEWLRSCCFNRSNRNGVLLLRGFDSKLSKILPSDLQKLRCKVSFHALKFAAPIQAVGDKITERMWHQGPYLALHLRLEKDVWVRTGCLPGLGVKYDKEVELERKTKPQFLTSRSNMSFEERRLAGLCPLKVNEVARLLRALGASQRTRIYWAGGEPFGGVKTLEPLQRSFPQLYNKEILALPGELEPFRHKASSLAAIDYLVCLSSDVFMPSHGGNMAHALKGHRAYTGHRKHIIPNKRQMISYFLNTTLPQEEFDKKMNELHIDSIGQPAMWTAKKGRDVIGYPVPECMCNRLEHSSY